MKDEAESPLWIREASRKSPMRARAVGMPTQPRTPTDGCHSFVMKSTHASEPADKYRR